MTFRIMTVCIGNICRSPLAERLLRVRLDDHFRAGTLVIDSAGVGAVVGHAMDDSALGELTRLGGAGDGFAARQLRAEHMVGADLVLTATVEIRARALREGPSALKRTFTLGEFAAICGAADDPTITTPEELVTFAATHRALAQGDLDVADPIGRDQGVHRAVADQIDAHVTAIASRLGPLLASRA